MRRTAQCPPTSKPPLEHGDVPNQKKSQVVVSGPSAATVTVVSRSKASDLDSRPPASFSPPSISVRPVSGLISGFNHFPFQGRLARVDSQQLRHGAPLNISNGIQALRQPRPGLHSDNRIQIIHQPFDNKSNHNFSAEFSRFHVSEINVTPADDSEHEDVESSIVHIKEEMPEEVSDDDDAANGSDSGEEKETTPTGQAIEVSKQPLDDHSVLRGIEKPGSPEKKRRSAFVCESLDTYLEENKPAQPDKCDPFDFKKKEEERATPTASVCTNEEDMKSMVVGCFRYFMFESLRDMKGHVLSTAMSKMAKGKSFDKEPSRMRGFRRKFGTTETIAVRHAGDRHKWKSGRHHARGIKKEAFRKLGFTVKVKVDKKEEKPTLVHCCAEVPTAVKPADKYKHMKVAAHRLSSAQTLTRAVTLKVLKTLTVIERKGKKVSLRRAASEQSQKRKLNDSLEFVNETLPEKQYDYDDTFALNTRKLPEPCVAEGKKFCGRDSCRLGCICQALMKCKWKRIVDKRHCGQASCIFGCVCRELKKYDLKNQVALLKCFY